MGQLAPAVLFPIHAVPASGTVVVWQAIPHSLFGGSRQKSPEERSRLQAARVVTHHSATVSFRVPSLSGFCSASPLRHTKTRPLRMYTAVVWSSPLVTCVLRCVVCLYPI